LLALKLIAAATGWPPARSSTVVPVTLSGSIGPLNATRTFVFTGTFTN